MSRAIIIDFETTGLLLPSTADLKDQPHIIEIGAVIVEDGEIVAELSQLINPEMPIPSIITKITGIKDDDVRDQPTFSDFYPQFFAFFNPQADFFIAHNAPFDSGVLKIELERVRSQYFTWPKNIICTVEHFKPFFGYRPKLVELYQSTLDRPLKQTHRALDDTKALWEILEKRGTIEELTEAYGVGDEEEV